MKKQLRKNDQVHNWRLLEDPPTSQKKTPMTSSKVKCCCLLCGDTYQVTYNNLISGVTKNCIYCRPKRKPPEDNVSCPECNKPASKGTRFYSSTQLSWVQWMNCRNCNSKFRVEISDPYQRSTADK